ncbi:unnamed protein product [Meganyctiphanes norvegica]|uniref:Fructose-2,6-bisphosphatase TIGAR n=1 Tax=Meganyctiphanes norvegica TaxID=48144 RepID=A0AAV2PQI3_MEGNR
MTDKLSIIMRNGETTLNRERKLQGTMDVPLSKLGEKQAQQAGVRLSNSCYSRAYASDLSRARVTCELILEKNMCNPPPIVTTPKLRERNFGCMEGLPFDDALAQAKAAGVSWMQFQPKGSETMGEVQERMIAFFKELCQSVYDKSHNNNGEEQAKDNETIDKNAVELENCEVSESILVVSHGAALRTLFTQFHTNYRCPVPGGNTDDVNQISPNTGLTEYIVRYSPKKYEMHCVRLYDGAHIEGLEE